VIENTKSEKEKMEQQTLTKYEYAVIVGARATQLMEGAKPLVALPPGDKSHKDYMYRIAKQEIMEQKLPFVVERKLPSGEIVSIPLAQLKVRDYDPLIK
jgi:DNA-directed RNA polymerases I, II, and III subunit RPABC2